MNWVRTAKLFGFCVFLSLLNFLFNSLLAGTFTNGDNILIAVRWCAALFIGAVFVSDLFKEKMKT